MRYRFLILFSFKSEPWLNSMSNVVRVIFVHIEFAVRTRSGINSCTKGTIAVSQMLRSALLILQIFEEFSLSEFTVILISSSQNAPEDKTSILTRINALLDSALDPSKWTSWCLFEFFWLRLEEQFYQIVGLNVTRKLLFRCIVFIDAAGRNLFSPQPVPQPTACGSFVSYPGFQPTPPDSRSPSPLHMDERAGELFMVTV